MCLVVLLPNTLLIPEYLPLRKKKKKNAPFFSAYPLRIDLQERPWLWQRETIGHCKMCRRKFEKDAVRLSDISLLILTDSLRLMQRFAKNRCSICKQVETFLSANSGFWHQELYPFPLLDLPLGEKCFFFRIFFILFL